MKILHKLSWSVSYEAPQPSNVLSKSTTFCVPSKQQDQIMYNPVDLLWVQEKEFSIIFPRWW